MIFKLTRTKCIDLKFSNRMSKNKVCSALLFSKKNLFDLKKWFSTLFLLLVLGFSSFSSANQQPFDPYEVLGVSRTASQKDIRNAYRSLAQQHHPDRSTGDEEKFKQVQKAYDVLKSGKSQKQSYDFDEVPEPIQRAVKDIVQIRKVSNNRHIGSGFIIRKARGRPILVTYRGVSLFDRDLSDVSVFTGEGKRLKIKTMLSDSAALNFALFELESYEGSGLKLAKHSAYSGTSAYTVNLREGVPQSVIKGLVVTPPEHKILSVIYDDVNILSLLGTQGGPILNDAGEVIGTTGKWKANSLAYRYGVSLKSSYLDEFIIPDTTGSLDLRISKPVFMTPLFLSKAFFSQLKKLADLGSVEAQNMLVKLDRRAVYDGVSAVVNGSIAFVILALLNGEHLDSFSSLKSFLLGAGLVLGTSNSVSSCSAVFRHIRNRVSVKN